MRCSSLTLALTLLAAPAAAHPAIATFNAWCFKAGQTEAQARANTGADADAAGFALTFWDDSLEPRPADAPAGVERRCRIAFDGDHARAARMALEKQMATPPVFGTPIAVPSTHRADADTVLIEGRALLRGRVAVVSIRVTDTPPRTAMTVDRLYDGLGLPE